MFPERIATLPVFQGRFTANKIESDQANVYFASYPAGTVIEPHTHDTDNHGIITSGELILEMNGKEYSYKVGEWYFIPANVEHSARFDVDTAEIEVWFKS